MAANFPFVKLSFLLNQKLENQRFRARPSKAERTRFLCFVRVPNGLRRFGGRRDPHPLYVATQRSAFEDRGEMSLGLATIAAASWPLENKTGVGSQFIDRGQKLMTFHHQSQRVSCGI